jgi:hypothetical protein
MEHGNLGFQLHVESTKDLAGFLTEFAQMQRVVGNHGKAEKAETIRNTLYSQHANVL